MNRQVVINVSESFSVLCTFWNIVPEEIIRFYINHISMSEMARRLELNPERKNEFLEEELKSIQEKVVADAFALATYYAIRSNSEQNQLSPIKLPKLSFMGNW